MRKDKRFFAGLIGVGAVVIYLVWTGVSATMQYYLTPAELMAKVAQNPSVVGRSIRVSGMVVPGSYSTSEDRLTHHFTVHDPENAEVTLAVEFRQLLPDTFTDAPDMEVEAVMEGSYTADGIFVATAVLTKCSSRYEAVPTEEVAAAGGGVIG